MPSLHWASHAMAVGVIAWLVRQQLQLRYHCQLQGSPPSCPDPRPPPPSPSADLIPDEQHQSTSISPSQAVNFTTLSTSISCWGESRGTRSCRFHNLCYRSASEDFVVFHGNSSVFENVPWSDTTGWLDMTSVADHNTHFFLPVDLQGKSADQFRISWVREPSLVLVRFKPDNIMHVLHDDIMPALHVLRMMFSREGKSQAYNATLVFADDWEDGLEFDWLYQSLSEHRMLTRESLVDWGEMVCFSDAVVGVSKSTTWYQYGFLSPQGPLPDVKVTAADIQAATSYILDRISFPCCECKETGYLVIFSRQQTRLILNEADLALSIAQAMGLRVLSLSLDLDSLQNIFQTVYCARGVIGMHGSLMIAAMFLQPGCFVVELFPYAVPPENYTPYKTLTTIPGMNLTYRAWTNPDLNKSVAHPDWSEELGGIEHLSPEEQEVIKRQTSVPQHLCCKDPSWLYHAYQDTFVDVETVTKLAQEAEEESRAFHSPSNSAVHSAPLPGSVENVSCDLSGDPGSPLRLAVSWSLPWNLQYLEYSECQVEIWLQDKLLSEEVMSITVPSCSVSTVDLEQVKHGHEYHVWVRVVLDRILTGSFQGVFNCRV